MKVRQSLKPIVSWLLLRVLRVSVNYSQETLNHFQTHQVIVCSNHVSLIDGIIVALASPVPLAFGVDTEFSRRSKLAAAGLRFMAWLGFGSVVPIDTSSPFGIRSLSKFMKQGDSVMLFPEGRISENGQPNPDQPGVKWLAAKHPDAVLVRIQIQGAEQSQIFAKSGTKFWPAINLIF